MSYVKIHSGLLTSTVFLLPDHVFRVWITLLVLADQDGNVSASLPGLAHTARQELSVCEDAVRVLEAPDRHSRTKDLDGRRIVPIDGGWFVVNHAKYRALQSAEHRRELTAARVKRHRALAAEKARNAAVTHVTPSDTDTKADPEPKQDPEIESAREAERIPPGLVLASAPTLAQAKANAKLAAHAERERLRAEKDAAKLRAVQARAELESARQAARDAKTAALPRSAPLSADWAPTEGHARTAAKRNLALELQADRFRAHAEEKGRVFRDRRHEDACFTSWLLSPYAKPESAPPSSRPRLTGELFATNPEQAAHRAAYLAGLSSAGLSLALVWRPEHDTQLAAAASAHAKSRRREDEGRPLEGTRLATWIQLAARDFALWLAANAAEARFYGAGAPAGFARWLNEDALREEQRHTDGRVGR